MGVYKSTNERVPRRIAPDKPEDDGYSDSVDLVLEMTMVVSGIGVLALFAVTFFSG